MKGPSGEKRFHLGEQRSDVAVRPVMFHSGRQMSRTVKSSQRIQCNTKMRLQGEHRIMANLFDIKVCITITVESVKSKQQLGMQILCAFHQVGAKIEDIVFA